MAGATVGVEVGELVGAVVVTGDVEFDVAGWDVGAGDTIDGLDDVVGVGAEENGDEGIEADEGAITGEALVEDAGSDIWAEDEFCLSSGRDSG
jgi:hypothetical protein